MWAVIRPLLVGECYSTADLDLQYCRNLAKVSQTSVENRCWAHLLIHASTQAKPLYLSHVVLPCWENMGRWRGWRLVGSTCFIQQAPDCGTMREPGNVVMSHASRWKWLHPTERFFSSYSAHTCVMKHAWFYKSIKSADIIEQATRIICRQLLCA